MIISIKTPLDLLDRLGIARIFSEEYIIRHTSARITVEALKSSYSVHGYDAFFYALARAWRPAIYVEFGVLSGYSLLSTSLAIRDNGSGRAIGIDLFEDYAFTKDTRDAVQGRIDRLQLGNWCTLIQRSVYDVEPSEINADILHIDISNNGDVVEHFFPTWRKHIRRAILFEGGGRKRDEVEWMVKYNKPRMYPVFERLSEANPDWTTYQIEAYPTLTALVRNP